MSDETLPGFTVAPRPEEKVSADRRRTERAKFMIAIGRHPFGRAQAENGKTCGDCWFACRVEGGRRRYWKCERNRFSSSTASDLRISWPACDLFKAERPEGYETKVPAYVQRGGR